MAVVHNSSIHKLSRSMLCEACWGRIKGMKCVCGKLAEYEENLRFNQFNIDGWVRSCGEIYYNPAKAEKILLLNKLQKERYNIKLGRSKSNLILRIPKEISDVLELNKGDDVELGLLSKNKIIIEF